MTKTLVMNINAPKVASSSTNRMNHVLKDISS